MTCALRERKDTSVPGQHSFIPVTKLHTLLPNALLLDNNLSRLSWIVIIITQTFTQTYDINRKRKEDFPTLPAPRLIPLIDNKQQIKCLKQGHSLEATTMLSYF